MVQVWDLPLRLGHWALAALVIIAWLTPNTHDMLHRIVGYGVIALLLFRFVRGGVRSHFARLLRTLLALPSYATALARGKKRRYLRLNPAGAAMLVALLVALSVSGITGAMQVTVRFFGVWWVEDTHAYASNAVMVLVVLHVAGTIFMSVLQRENLPRAMITGNKQRRSLSTR